MMAYMPYADAEYYFGEYGGTCVPEDEVPRALKKASRHVDILTFGRIVGRGFPGLTAFQQDIIKEVCCEMADFEHENADMIDSILQSYSINGVSMSFGDSWNVMLQNGIAIRRDTYAKLRGTGLACLRLGG